MNAEVWIDGKQMKGNIADHPIFFWSNEKSSKII